MNGRTCSASRWRSHGNTARTPHARSTSRCATSSIPRSIAQSRFSTRERDILERGAKLLLEKETLAEPELAELKAALKTAAAA